MTARGVTVEAGETITIDGGAGEVMLGSVPTIEPELSGDFGKLMVWADEFRTIGIRANAETPADAETSIHFGAEGIGLSRTEHMFFDTGRIVAVRQMIAPRPKRTAGRRSPSSCRCSGTISPLCSASWTDARSPSALLDPPLHEFLPHGEDEIAEVAAAAGVSAETVRRRAQELVEVNPMLGHRGCRLGITYPEITDAGARDLRGGGPGDRGGRKAGSARGDDPADRHQGGVRHPQGAGRPRRRGGRGGRGCGARLHDRLHDRAAARGAQGGRDRRDGEFFSYGTNDLTQTVFGLSRDDSSGFIRAYDELGVLERDPFVSIDIDGVGELVSLATERGRATRPDNKLGICGEHGGDPDSVRFCHRIGLDYVSCSPYRVPIARLAAAQAAIGARRREPPSAYPIRPVD